MRKRFFARGACILAGTVMLSSLAGCVQSTPESVNESTESVSEASTQAELSEEEKLQNLINEAKDAYFGTADNVRDYAKAFELFGQVIEADDSVGDAYYYQGKIQEKQYKYTDAVSSYDKGIEKGSEYARLALGCLYRDGIGVDQDIKKGRELIEKAVENGCVEANAGLADFYQSGSLDVLQNGDRALKLFEEAAKGTEPEWVSYALSSMGVMYADGQDVNADLNKAIEYYTKAHDALGYGYYDYIASVYQNRLYNPEKANEYYKLAHDEFEKEAEGGVPEAMCYMGVMYQQGLAVDKDMKKAVEWFEKAADAGDKNAIQNLAKLYYDGFLVDRDCAKAIELYEKTAKEAGEYGNYIQIAKLYKNGDGVEKNEDKAKEYLEKYLNEGGTRAAYQMASMYDIGNIVAQDTAKAVELYQKAADAGNYQAMMSLGNCYWNGNGVDKDQAKGAEMYLKSAEAGNTNMYLDLGYMYSRGDGFEKDEAKAQECFEKYAKANEGRGANTIGYQYHTGTILEKNVDKAKEWYERACNEGDKNAMVNMGSLYLNGDGVDKNPEEAIKWFEKAVDAGNTSCLLNIAYLYSQGVGVEKDEAKAEEYIGKYASDADHMKTLGEIYATGNSVIKKDEKKSFEWMEKASNAGSIPATTGLGYYYQKGFGTDADEAKGFELYQKAADCGDASAMTHLAEDYIWGTAIVNGEKVTDVPKGIEWAGKAADLGKVEAMDMLGLLYAGEGKNVEIEADNEKAFKYLGMAANYGDATAISQLKKMTDAGTFEEADTIRWLYNVKK